MTHPLQAVIILSSPSAAGKEHPLQMKLPAASSAAAAEGLDWTPLTLTPFTPAFFLKFMVDTAFKVGALRMEQPLQELMPAALTEQVAAAAAATKTKANFMMYRYYSDRTVPSPC